MTTLEINAQTIGFPSFDVLRDVHLTWNQSSNVLIIGANGSGKSTLLKYLLDLLPKQAGDVIYQGVSVFSKQKESVLAEFGVFFPEYRVYDFLTVRENLEIFAHYQGVENSNITQKLLDFHLLDVADIKAKYISLGNYKKVCLAVSLLGNPKLIVLDEPFLGVDKASIQIILTTLERMRLENDALVLLTTHELEPVADWFTELVHIKDKSIYRRLTKDELQERFGTLSNFQKEEYA